MDNLQRSLELNRKLLTLIQRSGSEAEVAGFVVDLLHEEFPQHRVSYSVLHPDRSFRIFCSRQPDGMLNISGLTGSLPDSVYAANLQKLHVCIIDDVREHETTQAISGEFQKKLGSVSRLDFPFEKKENGDIGVISLSNKDAHEWDPLLIELLTEIGELLHLLFREARIRERLYQSETVFRQFVDSLPMVFWVIEPVGSLDHQEIVYISPAYEEVWGLPVESLKADPFSFLRAIHPADRDRISASVFAGPKGPYENFYRVVRPDGSIRFIHDRGFPLFDESGKMYRNLGLAEDITALQEAKVKLEATQAQVVSNAKFAALGEMAGGIAHEINNPLAVISGLAHQMGALMQRQQLTDKILAGNLETIEKMSKSIAAIVKGLRTFSRQTEGDPLLRADLCSIVRETLALCEAKIQYATVKLEIRLPENAMFLNCRASEISQVVLNLLNNALDAVASSAEKKVSLWVAQKGKTAFLTVEDSGAGVNPEIRDFIFQPFFTTKEVGKGTGLGLSISKGIVESHGGRLYLEDNCPYTRFVVQLPLEV
ncbi:MAG: PAS domain-containing sensor histidine kinase [Bdellovibrionota bacterium]